MQDKGEILAKLQGLENLFNEKFEVNEKSHEAILEQVVKTNGRVGSLEGLKNKVIGALIVMNIVILPVIFIVINNYFK